jgi:cobalt-zinc-cadmium efflux system protein
MAMSLSAVPAGIDPGAVRGYLEKCKGVTQVHELHIWPMSTTEVALTCHMVMPAGQPGDAYLDGNCTPFEGKIRHPACHVAG